MKKLALVALLAVFAAVLLGIPASADVANVDFKTALTGGNLGNGYTIGLGISTENPSDGVHGVLGKVEMTYAWFSDGGILQNEVVVGRFSRANTTLKPNREGAVRFGFGGQANKRSRVFFMLEVVAGSASGNTTAQYLNETIWHPEYMDWENDVWYPGYNEYVVRQVTFAESQTYRGGGAGTEVELRLSRALSLNGEVAAGQIVVQTTWLDYGGQKNTNSLIRGYYRGRVGLVVHF